MNEEIVNIIFINNTKKFKEKNMKIKVKYSTKPEYLLSVLVRLILLEKCIAVFGQEQQHHFQQQYQKDELA